MSTTDRMPDLNSRRETVDRVGQTVILGNSVGAGALDIEPTIVAAAAGESEVITPFDMDASVSFDFLNASFGIWSVFMDIDAASNLSCAGATRRSANLLAAAVAALSFGTNGGGLIGVQVFTATGAYTPSAGTVSIVVEALGGGGGGAGSSAGGASSLSFGSGGGAGAVAIARITSSFSGVTVTVGAGGAGGAAGNNGGSNGGATTFGSVLSAGGGGGGNPTGGAVSVPNARYGGLGGSASGSASLLGAQVANGLTGYGTQFRAMGGFGARSPFGGCGLGAVVPGSVQAAGAAGTGFGSGGGGAATGALGTAQAGGAGTPGICIIYEYNT